jgi:predicted GNAT family N-acyltransferase
MAVLKQWRGMGVGRAILQAVLHELIQRRTSKAILNAQISAIGFYEKFGFRPEGAVFLEANIPHIKMILSLENT